LEPTSSSRNWFMARRQEGMTSVRCYSSGEWQYFVILGDHVYFYVIFWNELIMKWLILYKDLIRM
jgi:hypothetical protein